MGEGINGSADLGGQEDVFSTRQEKQTHVLTMNLRDISLDFLRLFFFLPLDFMNILSHYIKSD